VGESQKIEVENSPGRKGAEALAQERRVWGSMSESGDQNSPNTSGPSESGSGSSTSVCMYNGKGREWTVILGWVVGGDGCGLVS
jgi:hypothetical protein